MRSFMAKRFNPNLDITARDISFFDAIENIFNRVAIQKFAFHWIHLFYKKAPEPGDLGDTQKFFI